MLFRSVPCATCKAGGSLTAVVCATCEAGGALTAAVCATCEAGGALTAVLVEQVAAHGAVHAWRRAALVDLSLALAPSPTCRANTMLLIYCVPVSSTWLRTCTYVLPQHA